MSLIGLRKCKLYAEMKRVSSTTSRTYPQVDPIRREIFIGKSIDIDVASNLEATKDQADRLSKRISTISDTLLFRLQAQDQTVTAYETADDRPMRHIWPMWTSSRQLQPSKCLERSVVSKSCSEPRILISLEAFSQLLKQASSQFKVDNQRLSQHVLISPAFLKDIQHLVFYTGHYHHAALIQIVYYDLLLFLFQLIH